ncbi:MAG TPA: PqiC family protein [Candidatus Binataceae bacterium]|nr:PqiC family protein [Candidatus Binataceae bacterium]
MSRAARLIAGFVLTAAIAGCSILGPRPERSNFLVLTPVSADGNSSAAAAGQTPLAVGLGPVSLPNYLDRPEVVMRSSENTLALSSTDRWAEPLADNFRNVFEADLTTSLGNSRIVRYPWFANARPDYAVRVEVEQFEVSAADGAILKAHWSINNPKDGSTLVSRQADITQPMNSHDPQAIAAALSAALGDLSRQIAQALRGL